MKYVLFFRFVVTLALAIGISSASLYPQGQGGGAQRGGGQNMQNLSPEERVKRINEMIQKNVVEMAETVEIREDQQEAFVKAQANYEVQTLKIRGQVQSAGQDREKRMQARQSMQKLAQSTEKAMKGILDKEQFKAYQAKMKERMPQGRGGQGGGQRGG